MKCEQRMVATLPYNPAELAGLLHKRKRVLLYGEAGIGKSTLMKELAPHLTAMNPSWFGINADPGSPGFGLPGTVSLGRWRGENWRILSTEALCSLDAGRFRLPLLSAVKRLHGQIPKEDLLLIDAPGVARGNAGSELATGMVELLDIDTVLLLTCRSKSPPFLSELSALAAELFVVQAHPQAKRPGKKTRTNKRSALWQVHLADAEELTMPLSGLGLIGSPPPRDVPDAWSGRQCAFIESGRTVGIGEIVVLLDGVLTVKLPAAARTSNCLLLRDACYQENQLVSAAPFASDNMRFLPPPDALPYPMPDYRGGPQPVVKLRGLFATLINGVFGDPLLHLRLQQQQRSLLFDLGDSGRLPMRIAHQVSDVFISHAHIDHIGGFLWFLRSRLGEFPRCRLFGPPGLADHVRGLISGILWDRVGESGPRFEIAEIHGDRLLRTRIQAGYRGCCELSPVRLKQGLIIDEPQFSVRTTTLDHHGTPVQAYSFESRARLGVDNKTLKTMNVTAGPWLNRLKACIAEDRREALIRLPDGSVHEAGELGDRLLSTTPGEKLVYATDLADSEANREKLVALAKEADILFCEASFLTAEAEQARRTGHLTTRACAEIAARADVRQLVPFHFSRRYERKTAMVYRELSAFCSRVVTPKQTGIDRTLSE